MRRMNLFRMLVLVLLAAGFVLPQSAPKRQTLALVGGRLIDGWGGPPIENSVVLVTWVSMPKPDTSLPWMPP